MRPGNVDLRDLAGRGWEPKRLGRLLDGAGLVPSGDVVRRFAPPRVLIAVVGYDAAWMVTRSRAWLAASEHVIVCRDGAVDELAVDPELAPLYEEEWRDATAGLAIEIEVEIVDDFAHARARAMDAFSRLPARHADAATAAVEVELEELPPSPWSSYLAERFDRAFLDRIERVDREVIIGPPQPYEFLTPEEGRRRRTLNPGSLSLGTDPVHRPIGWRGDRMHVYWTWDGGFFAGSNHDYPCGPGKKLYGYEDNEPLQVVLAPDAEVYAARFGHDVLLSREVPLPWQRAGDFDVVVLAPDPLRTVFYAQDPNDDESAPRPVDLMDEDGRDCAPALVLAPEHHYALDLSLRVYRILRTEVGAAERVRVGGPDEGFAVFDGEHRLVRRASGKLLGGWYRWATIEADGAYWREDLPSGERTRIAPIDLTISEDPAIEAVARDAMLEGNFELASAVRSRGPIRTLTGLTVFALPATRNVLLVTTDHVRVV